MKLRLYNTAHSSPSYRVRIALALKGLDYAYVPIDLRARAHKADDYVGRNPQGLLPTLEVDGVALTQSSAIVEWLEETVPSPPLLPRDPLLRARARAIAALIATDITPLHSMRVSLAIRNEFGRGDEGLRAWVRRFLGDGFSAIEKLLGGLPGPYACHDQPTVADVFLVPAAHVAATSGFSIAPFARVASAVDTALAHPAFAAAHPSKQPDAPR